MLKRLRINNFKSLLNFEFKPVGMNLIIGQNNAGKTNLCSALRFLGLSSKYNLDNAMSYTLGERWNLTNFNVQDNSFIEIEMDCELMYEGEAVSFAYSLRLGTSNGKSTEAKSLNVEEERLTASGGPFAQTPLLENHKGKVKMLHEEGFVKGLANSPFYVTARVPDNATMLSQLYELENNPRAILFREFLRSWNYYNFSPDVLRQPNVKQDIDNDALAASGANLSRALFTIHNEKPRIEKKLYEIVRLLEPRLEYFTFSSPDPEHVHLFIEDMAGHHLSASSISDGTLRFIAMAYVIIMAKEQSHNVGFPPLAVIEEPENGLYVGHLKPLIEKIDVTGRCGQFFFTSHSPYFIDLFDSNIEGIHVVKSGHPSSVLVKPDPHEVERLLKEMPLGDMHFRDMLK
jgi:predicted ATPase